MKNADGENAIDPYKDYHSLYFKFVMFHLTDSAM